MQVPRQPFNRSHGVIHHHEAASLKQRTVVTIYIKLGVQLGLTLGLHV